MNVGTKKDFAKHGKHTCLPSPSIRGLEFIFPGDEIGNRNIEYNVDKANELLDSLGLTETDVEGFRLRTDAGRETEPLLLDIMLYHL